MISAAPIVTQQFMNPGAQIDVASMSDALGAFAEMDDEAEAPLPAFMGLDDVVQAVTFP